MDDIQQKEVPRRRVLSREKGHSILHGSFRDSAEGPHAYRHGYAMPKNREVPGQQGGAVTPCPPQPRWHGHTVLPGMVVLFLFSRVAT